MPPKPSTAYPAHAGTLQQRSNLIACLRSGLAARGATVEQDELESYLQDTNWDVTVAAGVWLTARRVLQGNPVPLHGIYDPPPIPAAVTQERIRSLG